jgi:hypothetical protein
MRVERFGRQEPFALTVTPFPAGKLRVFRGFLRLSISQTLLIGSHPASSRAAWSRSGMGPLRASFHR